MPRSKEEGEQANKETEKENEPSSSKIDLATGSGTLSMNGNKLEGRTGERDKQRRNASSSERTFSEKEQNTKWAEKTAAHP